MPRSVAPLIAFVVLMSSMPAALAEGTPARLDLSGVSAPLRSTSTARAPRIKEIERRRLCEATRDRTTADCLNACAYADNEVCRRTCVNDHVATYRTCR